jgi:hypothetical protein
VPLHAGWAREFRRCRCQWDDSSPTPLHLSPSELNHPEVHPRTWQSEHMSGYRYSSASVPTGSGRTTTALQEFEGATFTVDLIAQGAPLHADQNDVQKVFDLLRDNCKVTHVTLFGDDKSTKDVPQLPPSGFRAVSKSYEPLTHLLSVIVHAANICLTRARYLKDLHFDLHGVEMQEKVDSEKPLKPVILGLLHPRTPDEPKLSWNDVAVFIAVKSHLIESVKQLATYAHCHLAVDRRRSFSIAIAFSHKALTLHFLCFHRSGISISPPLHLNEEDGFRSVVEHMVGILSIRDEEAFGLDMTRVKDVYRLNGHNYDIVRTIQLRESVRGLSTVVYTLKRAVSFSLVRTRLTRVHPGQTAGGQDYPASLRSRELTLVDGVPQFPEKMVYKMSYQIEGHPSEGIFFSGFHGHFGVVDLVGFHVCSSEELFGSTASHFSNPRFLKLDDETPVGIIERRYLHCTAMALEGLPLLDFPDNKDGLPKPAELLETILHSMIGE